MSIDWCEQAACPASECVECRHTRPVALMSSEAQQPFPVGTRVLERAWPDSFVGTVAGHAPDGWTFVDWQLPGGKVNKLSHPPHELMNAPTTNKE